MMTPTATQLKAVRAFQNNGPDYWLIYEGKKTFGADPVARCDNEEQANKIVHCVNVHDELVKALEVALEDINNTVETDVLDGLVASPDDHGLAATHGIVWCALAKAKRVRNVHTRSEATKGEAS